MFDRYRLASSDERWLGRPILQCQRDRQRPDRNRVGVNGLVDNLVDIFE
ncbi:MAG: hypothetical protein LH624_08475 [Cryobacterium sp.]|nr:hypothetical protein [Cryobacterium sp.]